MIFFIQIEKHTDRNQCLRWNLVYFSVLFYISLPIGAMIFKPSLSTDCPLGDRVRIGKIWDFGKSWGNCPEEKKWKYLGLWEIMGKFPLVEGKVKIGSIWDCGKSWRKEEKTKPDLNSGKRRNPPMAVFGSQPFRMSPPSCLVVEKWSCWWKN